MSKNKTEGCNLELDKEVAPDQVVSEVSTEVPEKTKVEDKVEFEQFKELYKERIKEKCLAEYGDAEDTKLFDDMAKELYLASEKYVPDETDKPQGEISDKKHLKEAQDDEVRFSLTSVCNATVTVEIDPDFVDEDSLQNILQTYSDVANLGITEVQEAYNNLDDYSQDNLAEYIDENNKFLYGKVKEIYIELLDNCRLRANIVASREVLDNDDAITSLEDYLSGQYSDGWGEGLEQQELCTWEDIYSTGWGEEERTTYTLSLDPFMYGKSFDWKLEESKKVTESVELEYGDILEVNGYQVVRASEGYRVLKNYQKIDGLQEFKTVEEAEDKIVELKKEVVENIKSQLTQEEFKSSMSNFLLMSTDIIPTEILDRVETEGAKGNLTEEEFEEYYNKYLSQINRYNINDLLTSVYRMTNKSLKESKKVTEDSNRNDIEEKLNQAKDWLERVEKAREAEDFEPIIDEILESLKFLQETNYAAEDICFSVKGVMDNADAYDRGPVTYFRSVQSNLKDAIEQFIEDYEDAVNEEELDESKKCESESKDKTENEKLEESDDEYKYMLLNRLKSDCDYYLGYGNKKAKYLWAGNEQGQIAKMKEIYNQLSEKPEWLTMDQIEEYAKQMGVEELPSTVDGTAKKTIDNMLNKVHHYDETEE